MESDSPGFSPPMARQRKVRRLQLAVVVEEPPNSRRRDSDDDAPVTVPARLYHAPRKPEDGRSVATRNAATRELNHARHYEEDELSAQLSTLGMNPVQKRLFGRVGSRGRSTSDGEDGGDTQQKRERDRSGTPKHCRRGPPVHWRR